MDRRYRGLAIFGPPGSGKTTVAGEVARRLAVPNRILEASQEVIAPGIRRGFARHEARAFFRRLMKKEGQAAVAKRIDRRCRTKYADIFPVISGLRGYANAVWFARHGYLVVFLTAPRPRLVRRLTADRGISRREAECDIAEEEKLYRTSRIARIAGLAFDTTKASRRAIVAKIGDRLIIRECRRCVNTSANPTIRIGRDGLCQVCAAYAKHFDPRRLERERRGLRSSIGRARPYDAMVGLSGGKDSTAALWTVKRMGFTPLAFTFDTGYYPKHIFRRARAVARKLGVDHVIIDIRNYARSADLASFRKTADLYDAAKTTHAHLIRSYQMSVRFLELYRKNRAHYSVKCRHAMAFVRSCQLCRRLVIRAYYEEAAKRGMPLVILGINEWAALSRTASGRPVFSAMRRLKPYKDRPAVSVVHLPFLLRRKRRDTFRILRRLGWAPPKGESEIESNANSCLFARATEAKAKRLLGFHPDATRLGREVTAGFITKEEAKRALAKTHRPRRTVRQLLEKAGLLGYT